MKMLLLVAFVCNVLVCFGQKFEGLAPTPPMGWNSWYCYRGAINEENIKGIADAFINRGLMDAGYEFVNLDDGWQNNDRGDNGELLWDAEKFPSGIKALSDYMHDRGLKLGIYNCAGTKTCAKYPGIRGYEYQDAKTYANWGIDFIKIDWCNTGNQSAEDSYTLISNAINKAGRPMILSICEWGKSQPWTWAENVAQMWRSTGDIRDCWDCLWDQKPNGVLGMAHRQEEFNKYAGPDNWNDPDMLMIGLGGLTIAEERSHFSLWAMMASPLILSCDIMALSDEQIEIITNEEVIAVDQDERGIQGTNTYKDGNIEIWEKVIKGGKVFCFINTADDTVKQKFSWRMLRITDKRYIRDLWKHKNIGNTESTPVFEVEIPSHDVVMLKVSQ